MLQQNRRMSKRNVSIAREDECLPSCKLSDIEESNVETGSAAVSPVQKYVQLKLKIAEGDWHSLWKAFIQRCIPQVRL